MALSLTLTSVGSGVVSGTDEQGKAWEVRYEGFASPLRLWAAVNADGFYLAPGARFDMFGTTPLVRE